MYDIGNVVELQWFAFVSLSDSNVTNTTRSRGPESKWGKYFQLNSNLNLNMQNNKA